MSESTLRDKIQTLLNTQTDPLTLRYELEALVAPDPQGFGQAADLWLPALVQNDPAFFANFIQQRFNQNSPQNISVAAINAILPLLEHFDVSALYRVLSNKVATREDWNAEVLRLAESNMSNDALKRALDMRATPHFWLE